MPIEHNTPAAGTTPTVGIPQEHYEEMVRAADRLAELERQNVELETRSIIEKRDADAVMKRLQDQTNAAESRGKAMAIQSEISEALSGFNLVGEHAARKLSTLLAPSLVPDPAEKGYMVRNATTFESADDFIRSQLAQPHFKHFLAGGQAATTPQAASSTPTSNPTPWRANFPRSRSKPRTASAAVAISSRSKPLWRPF
jgi:hypothetical protein